jgi:hypothetical protein
LSGAKPAKNRSLPSCPAFSFQQYILKSKYFNRFRPAVYQIIPKNYPASLPGVPGAAYLAKTIPWVNGIKHVTLQALFQHFK